MTETVITVQGKYTSFHPAERATVRISVQSDGPKRDTVFNTVNSSAELVRNQIGALHDVDAGPITWWSSDSVQVWGDRPWNQDGKQLPLVFHARIEFTAKFSDFEKLAGFVEQVARVEGAAINQPEWALTQNSLVAATAEVRSRAVKDAVAKATVYAQSIGLGTVRATAIADPGMLGDQVGASGGGVQFASSTRRLMTQGDAAAPELSFKPEDIEVSAVVDARFVATAG